MFSSIVTKAKRFYLNYSMVTALYMMEPIEVYTLNAIVVLVFMTMLYSTWVYLPHYTWRLMVFCKILSIESDGMMLDTMEENPMFGHHEVEL